MSNSITNKAALLSAAPGYINLGWHLFLCGTDKKPLQKGGFKNASPDIGRLDKALARNPDGMLGIRTGAESGLIVIDIDHDEAKGVDGRPWLDAARTKGLPDCPMVTTPRGGMHIYFAHPGDAILCSASKLAPGVDVRGDGGYIIAPPSRSPKGSYSWLRSPVEVTPPPIPAWLLEELSPPKPGPVYDAASPLAEADMPEIEREVEAALTRLREAKSGSRNDTLNRSAFIIGKMVGAGAIGHETAIGRLMEAAMAAGLPEAEARRTAEGGVRAGRRQPWHPRGSEPELSRINRDHFYALDGRTGFVFREDHDPLMKRQILQHIAPGAFREQHGNRWVIAISARGPKPAPLGETWMKWPGRRQYDKVVFAPGKNLPSTIYNMWQGFTTEPIPGECGKFVGLIRDVICDGGKADLFNYLMSWLARALQQPWHPGEVAVVMRGEKGTGKTFFADHFGELFGEHYVQMSSSHHLVGNFNAHLETAIITFADEAFWAGDKQGEGTLKTLITGKTIRIERKGIDSKMVPNHIHLLMASNSDWVVPATADERRYLVLDVSSARRQDHAYFAEIEAEWQAGGREAFMHLLSAHNLSGFNVRNVPATEALMSQKLLSMPPVDRWFLRMLRAGINDASCWQGWISSDELWEQFSEWCKTESARAGTREALGMRLSALLPPSPDGRGRRRQRQIQGSEIRRWGYDFPALAECRQHFERLIGGGIDWEVDDPKNDPIIQAF